MNLLDIMRLTHYILSSVGIGLTHYFLHILHFIVELELLSLLSDIVFTLLVFFVISSYSLFANFFR